MTKIKLKTGKGKGFHRYSEVHSFNAKLPKGSKGLRPTESIKSHRLREIELGEMRTKFKAKQIKILEEREKTRKAEMKARQLKSGYYKMPKRQVEELRRREIAKVEAKLAAIEKGRQARFTQYQKTPEGRAKAKIRTIRLKQQLKAAKQIKWRPLKKAYVKARKFARISPQAKTELPQLIVSKLPSEVETRSKTDVQPAF